MDKFTSCKAIKAPPGSPDGESSWCHTLKERRDKPEPPQRPPRAPPSPFLPAPSPSPPPPPAVATAESLNARFRGTAGGRDRGSFGADRGGLGTSARADTVLVADVGDGLLLHAFDKTDPAEMDADWWWPLDSSGTPLDRLSATLINSRMQPDPTGALPVYSYQLGGVVLNPDAAELLCVYEADAGSLRRNCPVPVRSSGSSAAGSRSPSNDPTPGSDWGACVPGCTPTHVVVTDAPSDVDRARSYWCDEDDVRWYEQHQYRLRGEAAGTLPKGGLPSQMPERAPNASRGYACAWAPQNLTQAMAAWALIRAANWTHCHERCQQNWLRHDGGRNAVAVEATSGYYYNEVVLSAPRLRSLLPWSIDAIYFVDGVDDSSCVDLAGRRVQRCEAFARRAHRHLAEAYGVDVPLLRLRLHDWERPFTPAEMPPGPPAPLSPPLRPPGPPESWERYSGPYVYDWFRVDASPAQPQFISPGHPLYTDRVYLPTREAARARDIILSHDAARPLFVYVAFAAVHIPAQATADLLARVDAVRGANYFASCGWFDWGPLRNPMPVNPYSPQPSIPTDDVSSTCQPRERRLLEAMALSIDDAVGTIVTALYRRHMWNRSLLVFASDNGGAFNAQGSNKPLRGGKNGNFEGGIRVPAAVGGGWLPDNLRGRSSATLSHLADWYPTLCHAAGIDPTDVRSHRVAPVDGHSLWAAWQSDARPERTIVIEGGLAMTQTARGELLKLSTEDLLLCSDRADWSLAACSPARTAACAANSDGGDAGARTSQSSVTADTVACPQPAPEIAAALIGGYGEACSTGVPCLYDVGDDEREEIRLNASAEQYARAVRHMLDVLRRSAVPTADPFYPGDLQCPDKERLKLNGMVMEPAPLTTALGDAQPPSIPPLPMSELLILPLPPPGSSPMPPLPPSAPAPPSPPPYPPVLPPHPLPPPPRSPSHPLPARPLQLMTSPVNPLPALASPPPPSMPSLGQMTAPISSPASLPILAVLSAAGLTLGAALMVVSGCRKLRCSAPVLWRRYVQMSDEVTSSSTSSTLDQTDARTDGVQMSGAGHTRGNLEESSPLGTRDGPAGPSQLPWCLSGAIGGRGRERFRAGCICSLLVAAALILLSVGLKADRRASVSEDQVMDHAPTAWPLPPSQPPPPSDSMRPSSALPPVSLRRHDHLQQSNASPQVLSPWPPSLPQSPAVPALAPPPSPPMSVLERINARFRAQAALRSSGEAKGASNHTGAGILIHQFDPDDGASADAPWWVARGRDRMSASIINAHMQLDPSGSLPLYSYELAGVVLAPEFVEVLCAYERDAASKKRDCPSAAAIGTSAAIAPPCIPGCTPTMEAGWQSLGDSFWCTDADKRLDVGIAQHAEDSQHHFACPWRTLGDMMDRWYVMRQANFSTCGPKCERRRAGLHGAALRHFNEYVLGHYYNEVVLSRSAFAHALPYSVEAIFFVDGVSDADCAAHKAAPGDSLRVPRCEAFARAAHASLLSAFELDVSDQSIPLLRLVMHDRESPFRPA